MINKNQSKLEINKNKFVKLSTFVKMKTRESESHEQQFQQLNSVSKLKKSLILPTVDNLSSIKKSQPISLLSYLNHTLENEKIYQNPNNNPIDNEKNIVNNHQISQSVKSSSHKCLPLALYYKSSPTISKIPSTKRITTNRTPIQIKSTSQLNSQNPILSTHQEQSLQLESPILEQKVVYWEISYHPSQMFYDSDTFQFNNSSWKLILEHNSNKSTKKLNDNYNIFLYCINYNYYKNLYKSLTILCEFHINSQLKSSYCLPSNAYYRSFSEKSPCQGYENYITKNNLVKFVQNGKLVITVELKLKNRI